MVNVETMDVNDHFCLEKCLLWPNDILLCIGTSKRFDEDTKVLNCAENLNKKNYDPKKPTVQSGPEASNNDDEPVFKNNGSKHYYCKNRECRTQSRNRVAIFNAPAENFRNLWDSTTFDSSSCYNMAEIRSTKSMDDGFGEKTCVDDIF